MARDRLTEAEFEEVFSDHLARNPMARHSFTKLPENVGNKLQDEWFDVWRKYELRDLQAASKKFLADPDHPLHPGRDMNKHCGRVAKLALQFWRDRRTIEISTSSQFAPDDGGPSRPGCPTCQGFCGRRIRVFPFGEFKSWAIEIFGVEHWQAAREILLPCPCNAELIESLEDMYNVDATEDHFPRNQPRGDDWPMSVPTIYNEDRHEQYDFKAHWLTKCRYEKDVLELGKPRNRFGPNPVTGETLLDDVVDMVWGDAPFRPIPDDLKFRKEWSTAYKPARGNRQSRPEPKKLGHVVGRVTEDIEKAVALKDRQLPPRDRDDFEPHAEALREAASAFQETDDEADATFLGMDEDELDEELGPPTSLNFEGPPAEPETISREERRRRRRAALGKDS